MSVPCLDGKAVFFQNSSLLQRLLPLQRWSDASLSRQLVDDRRGGYFTRWKGGRLLNGTLALQTFCISFSCFSSTVPMRTLNKLLSTGQLTDSALEETDCHQRTALHLSIICRMPDQFISALADCMNSPLLDRRDDKGRRAVDYLVRTRHDYIVLRNCLPRILVCHFLSSLLPLTAVILSSLSYSPILFDFLSCYAFLPICCIDSWY